VVADFLAVLQNISGNHVATEWQKMVKKLDQKLNTGLEEQIDLKNLIKAISVLRKTYNLGIN
jgi:hypothetical protein